VDHRQGETKVKVNHLYKAIATLTIVFLASYLSADFNDEFESFFGDNALSIVNGKVKSEGRYQGQAGKVRWDGYVDLGVKSEFTPPSINGGCGGFDYHFGSFEFAVGDNFEAFWKSFSDNIVSVGTYTLVSYLKSLCNICTNTMEYLQNVSNSFNNMQIDSCQAAQDVVGFAEDELTSIFSKQAEEATESASGMYGSAYKGKVAGTDNPTEATKDATSYLTSNSNTNLDASNAYASAEEKAPGNRLNFGSPLFRVLNAQRDDRSWRRLALILTPDIDWATLNASEITLVKKRILSDLSFILGITVYQNDTATAAAKGLDNSAVSKKVSDNSNSIVTNFTIHEVSPKGTLSLEDVVDITNSIATIPHVSICNLLSPGTGCALGIDGSFNATGVEGGVPVNFYKRFITLRQLFFGTPSATKRVAATSILGKLDSKAACKITDTNNCDNSSWDFNNAELSALNYMNVRLDGINFWHTLTEQAKEPGQVVTWANIYFRSFEGDYISEMLLDALSVLKDDSIWLVEKLPTHALRTQISGNLIDAIDQSISNITKERESYLRAQHDKIDYLKHVVQSGE